MSAPDRRSQESRFDADLRAQFTYEPTEGQDRLIRFLTKFMFSDKPNPTLVIRGYAGTGKTTMTGALVKVLRQMRRKVVLMAPTGRAAKVLSSFADYPAATIHRTIYTKNADHAGVSFSLATNTRKNTVFMVDEASMIGEGGGIESEGFGEPRDLLDDLMTYVFSGDECRLILIGDTAQLPPVGSDDSPALRWQELAARYFLTAAEVELKEVVRQELDSGILYNANTLRLQLAASGSGFPQLTTEDFTDIRRIDGTELPEVYDVLQSRYTEQGVIIITRSNKRANQFNQHIRQRIFYREEEVSGGDLLMVVKNNYFWLEGFKEAPTDFIANGDTLEVQRVLRYQERYGLRFADVEVQMLDYPGFPPFEVKILLDTLTVEQANLGFDRMKRFYDLVAADYLHLGFKRAVAQAVRKDPFYNALQVKYGYAVTCHKSQGGQWPAVIVDQGYITEDMLDASLLRWFYTAFTRARRELWLLNFSDSFFGG